MSGHNMESLLLNNDDDSSSGDSETEVAVNKAGTPAAVSTSVAAAPPSQAPSQTYLQHGVSMTQSEMSMRLKSMYSPASKGATSSGAGGQHGMSGSMQIPQQVQQTQRMSSQPMAMHQQQPPRMPPQQPSSRPGGTSSNAPTQAGVRRNTDPFEPTPLSKILEREKQKAAAAAVARSMPPQHRPTNYSTTAPPPQQQQQQHMAVGTAQSSQTSTTPSVSTFQTSNMDRAAVERELKKQKERFLVFTRVLMTYLERKDPAVHVKVKAIINDCDERNKRHEPGYESVTNSMRTRLKEVVSDQYWNRAEAYLQQFLQSKAKASSGSSGTAALGVVNMVTVGQDKAAQDAATRKKAEMLRQMQAPKAAQAAAAGAAQQQQQRPQTQAAPTLNTLRHDIAKQRQALAPSSAPASIRVIAATSMPYSASTGAAAKGAAVTKGGKAVASKGSRSGNAATGSPSLSRKPSTETAPIIREYNEFMEMVDNSVQWDWATSGLVVGQGIPLSEEQQQLLYYDRSPQPTPVVAPFPISGWSQRNVLSARLCWARVRLNGIAGSGLPLPVAAAGVSQSGVMAPWTSWHNDEMAEQDLVLAALSEGAELYIKSLIEKALYCARQRQNLDGVRLWHQQMIPGGDKPAMSLRLGADVRRQTARASGNAALTCKRMEEALERHERVPARERVLNQETLEKAQSMSDLALRPKLLSGALNADTEAKRCFEVYGGKDTNANEPLLGPLLKKAKIDVVDFQLGMQIAGRGPQRAVTVSGSFAF